MLRDDVDLLEDPFLMADMDTAVSRNQNGDRIRERIAVYGDYDVDGITSTSPYYRLPQKKRTALRSVYPEG
jgi:single-stranded-DNA-specific exonuclease